MLNIPEPVKGITHPLIKDIYLKKDFGADHQSEDVLVIEARHDERSDDAQEYDAFDSYLIDLLTDLHDLQMQAESKIGHFDRIDIQTH